MIMKRKKGYGVSDAEVCEGLEYHTKELIISL